MRLRVPHYRVLGLMTLACLGAPLVALALSGMFSRYAADDYCTAGQVRIAGLIEAQSRLYVAWSGRFAATLLVTLVELIGPLAVPFLPGLALLAWLATATLTVRELVAALSWRLPLVLSAVMATLLVFATLQTAADAPQVLYWQTGVLTYLLSLVLATAYVGWVAHVVTAGAGRSPSAIQGGNSGAVRWPVAVTVSFVLAFVAGGTSETFAAAQVAALVLACVLASLSGVRPGRSTLQAVLLAGLLGALIALVLVAVAPGNSVRQENAERTPMSIALPQAIEFGLGWLRLTFARPHAAVLLLLVGVPAAIGASTEASAQTHPTSASLQLQGRWAGSSPSGQWVRLGLGGVAIALVILACLLPAFYALGSNPPGRAQVIPQYVLICSLAALGWFLGTATASGLRRIVSTPAMGWVALGGLVVLLSLGPLLMLRDVLQQVAPARVYAAAWDQLDREVRAESTQGIQDVIVRPLPSSGLVQNLDFVGPNRHDWFNECVARYYDLDTIASTLGVP